MTPQQLDRLNHELDRVPVELLRDALRRRRAIHTGKHDPLDDLRKCQYKVALDMVSERHQLHPKQILSNSKVEQIVHARWALYRRLHELGFKPIEIAVATGHDRTRIAYGLKQSLPA